MSGDRGGKVAGSSIGDIQGTLMLPLAGQVKSGWDICREGTSSVVLEALVGVWAFFCSRRTKLRLVAFYGFWLGDLGIFFVSLISLGESWTIGDITA